MRVSVDKRDIGYTPFHAHFEVYCDGVLLTDCTTADDVVGVVVRFRRAVDGQLVVDEETGLPTTFTQCGSIRIVDRRVA